MRLIYIAGPFRAANSWEVEQNIRRAESLSLEVWRLGAAAICPHTNTRFFSGAAADAVWLAGNIEILKRCDAVMLTPDWQRSSGARAEVKVADDLGIPVFVALEDLAIWLAMQISIDQSIEQERSRREYLAKRKADMDQLIALVPL